MCTSHLPLCSGIRVSNLCKLHPPLPRGGTVGRLEGERYFCPHPCFRWCTHQWLPVLLSPPCVLRSNPPAGRALTRRFWLWWHLVSLCQPQLWLVPGWSFLFILCLSRQTPSFGQPPVDSDELQTTPVLAVPLTCHREKPQILPHHNSSHVPPGLCVKCLGSVTLRLSPW